MDQIWNQSYPCFLYLLIFSIRFWTKSCWLWILACQYVCNYSKSTMYFGFPQQKKKVFRIIKSFVTQLTFSDVIIYIYIYNCKIIIQINVYKQKKKNVYKQNDGRVLIKQVPNGAGLLLGAAQLLLYFIYRNPNSSKKVSNDLEDQLQNERLLPSTAS